MEPRAQSRYTPEQYLALEREAVQKSEYVNGHILAMAGASRRHNQITFNLAVALGGQLKERPCVAYVNDMRVKVSATGLYTYPDMAALCGEPGFEDNHMDTLLNPMVIVEVLSDSTEAYDRGAKFAHCRRLPSLTEYVLIAQDKVCVEHYVRQGKQWLLSEVDGLDGTIQLDSIGCSLSLEEIYDKIKFPDQDRATGNMQPA
ncbi:MAG: Uma2 family endonuclease [Deltaproteobacteria bacterium]|nr:Uma2 family endonuclease [Deltaproteobacteria bacterium]